MTLLLQIGLTGLMQSTALLGLGLLALWLARRRGPAVQTLVGRAALVGVVVALILAVPLAGRVQPLWRVSLPTERPPAPNNSEIEAEVPSPAAVSPVPALPPDAAAPAPSPAASLPTPIALPDTLPAPATPLPRFYAILMMLWGTGTFGFLLWLGVCQRHLTRLRRAARPLTTGPAADALAGLTPHPPRLLAHPAVRSPFLAGLRHPAIFLPADAETDFRPDALRAILAHELAHLARRDCAWTLFCRLLCAALWPQPFLWLLCRRLEAVGEEACDLSVLTHDCPPRAYADCLLTLAERWQPSRRERVLGAGVAPFRSSLGRRVQLILDKGTHTMSTVSARLRLTIAAFTIATVIGTGLFVSSAPAQVKPSGPVSAVNPSLVGIWTVKYAPNPAHPDKVLSATLVLGSQGDLVSVENQGSQCAYGHYDASGSVLNVILTRTEDSGHIAPVSSQAAPETLILPYSLKDGILTLHRKYAPPSTARRIADYPEGISIEAVAAQQAALLKPIQATQQASALSQARFLAGLTPVQGPGVVVTLNDSKKPFPQRLPPGMTPPNLIHDTDINQVVNELKAAGAEAIAANDQRLVATSFVRSAGPTIFVNNTSQVSPYVITAIGNPAVLSAALNLHDGIASQLKSFDPAMISLREAGTLTLPAYSGGVAPRYARPVPGAPDAAEPDLRHPAP